jgi:hypothetical protein
LGVTGKLPINFDGGKSSRRSAPFLWLVCHLFTIAGNGYCVPTLNSCGKGFGEEVFRLWRVELVAEKIDQSQWISLAL